MLVGFYLSVVQVVLLFVLEMWVVSKHTGRILGGFYYRVIL